LYEGKHYVNGSWLKHSSDFKDINPCDPEEVIGVFPVADEEIVSSAVESAHAAFKEWKQISRVQRADYFDKLAQLIKEFHGSLALAISHETGKNLNESNAEVIEALHMCQYAFSTGRMPYGSKIASELSSKDAEVIRKPKGVIGVISPWNFPVAIGGFWASAPSIVEGNCVVWKPSELTPMTAQMVVELYDEAGFPPGVINLIHGHGDSGNMLVRHPKVKHILFTGSAEVGRSIDEYCASIYGKGCTYETGSKSATIVFEDGNIDLALEVSVASAFKLTGQRCVSSGRILIAREIYDYFCDKFSERVKELVTSGDPFTKPAPYHGPLISSEQKQKVLEYNNMVANDPDCQVLVWNEDDSRAGYYVNPMVYKTEWGNKPFLKNEVFGPHVALIPFDSVDQAIDIYNDTEYGLSVGIITDDFKIMKRCRDDCNAGMIYLNGGSIAAESHLPFGGLGKSGNGHKSASGTYRAVTDEVAITTNYEHQMQWAQGMKS